VPSIPTSSSPIISPKKNPNPTQSKNRNHYRPCGQAAETLVKQLIDNHWFLLRASNRLEHVESRLDEYVFSWTADEQKLFNNIQPYKTTAQRTFDKSFRAVETYFRDGRRDQKAVAGAFH
jgi:hypothetical protein